NHRNESKQAGRRSNRFDELLRANQDNGQPENPEFRTAVDIKRHRCVSLWSRWREKLQTTESEQPIQCAIVSNGSPMTRSVSICRTIGGQAAQNVADVPHRVLPTRGRRRAQGPIRRAQSGLARCEPRPQSEVARLENILLPASRTASATTKG